MSYGWLEGVGFPCLSGLWLCQPALRLVPYLRSHTWRVMQPYSPAIQHPAPVVLPPADGPKAYLEASRPASDSIPRERAQPGQLSSVQPAFGFVTRLELTTRLLLHLLLRFLWLGW